MGGYPCVNYLSECRAQFSDEDSPVYLFQCILFQHSLKGTYDILVLELRKVQDIYQLGRGGSDFSWERKLADLLVHIIEYTSAKRVMLDLYPVECRSVELHALTDRQTERQTNRQMDRQTD